MTDISVNSAGVSNEAVMQHLGKNVNYPTKYDPRVLVREPRENNRKAVGIDPVSLPFKGYDVWHLWEMTCINDETNEPEVAVFKVCYDCKSKYIVESKSLKLYTFSFNNERFSKGLKEVADMMVQDLSSLLETKVTVKMYPATYTDNITVNNTRPFSFNKDFINIDQNQSVIAYTDDLSVNRNNTANMFFESKEIYLHTSLLRSLCRVTSQPDMGDCFLTVKLDRSLNVFNVSKKFKEIVVDYRNQNHFHEESCEGIFKALQDYFEGSVITMGVFCLYTRRGGIDINPFRYYSRDAFDHSLETLGRSKLFKTIRQ